MSLPETDTRIMRLGASRLSEVLFSKLEFLCSPVLDSENKLLLKSESSISLLSQTNINPICAIKSIDANRVITLKSVLQPIFKR